MKCKYCGRKMKWLGDKACWKTLTMKKEYQCGCGSKATVQQIQKKKKIGC